MRTSDRNPHHSSWIAAAVRAPLAALPDRWRPYGELARLDKPIGFLLLMWPCWWAVALAGPPLLEGLRLLALFAVGAFVMRSAGCAYNDIVDRDIDPRVARTRERPLARGALTVRQAAGFMIACALIGLVVLVQLDSLAIWIGLSSLVLVAVYPHMKRVTYWPQAFLGLTFNWGALVGWAAATGELAPAAFALYAAGIAWTLGYDTIYAHQDKEDDALVGVKSSALALGPATRPWLFVFYALTVTGLVLAAALAERGWGVYVALVPAALHLARQARAVALDDPASCLAAFKSNNLFAALVFAAYLLFG